MSCPWSMVAALRKKTRMRSQGVLPEPENDAAAGSATAVK